MKLGLIFLFIIATFFQAFAQREETNYEDALLLDVRSTMEYQQEAVPGSINIPLGELKNRLNELKVKKADKIVVYCLSGSRSSAAKQYLEANGYTHVVNAYTCQNVCNSLGVKAVKLN